MSKARWGYGKGNEMTESENKLIIAKIEQLQAESAQKTVAITALEIIRDNLQAENKWLRRENNQLLDICLAAGFIENGTQIIGDKRYEELIEAEIELKKRMKEEIV